MSSKSKEVDSKMQLAGEGRQGHSRGDEEDEEDSALELDPQQLQLLM